MKSKHTTKRKHPIPPKRRKRQIIGWTIVVFIVAVVVLMSCMDNEAAERPSEKRQLEKGMFIIPYDAIAQAEKPTPSPFGASFSDEEITIAAKTVWGEARGIESQMEQAAVVWCALNRCDKYGTSLAEVLTAPNQFHYDPSFPTVDDFGRDLEELARDVISRWQREKNGETNVGRVLPSEYTYFGGDGSHNYFRADYNFDGKTWDWSLSNPYENSGDAKDAVIRKNH